MLVHRVLVSSYGNVGSCGPQNKLEPQIFQDPHCVTPEAARAVFAEGY